jgi:hypothetical protein
MSSDWEALSLAGALLDCEELRLTDPNRTPAA